MQVLEIAGQDLGCSAEDLKLMNGVVVYKEQGLTLAELFKKHTLHTVTAVADFLAEITPMDPETGQGSPAGTFSFSVHLALVEVDEGTGQVQVLRYVALGDVGRTINPSIVEGQIRGGVMMGLGYALTEEIRVEEGVANPSFATYLIPTSFDVPQELLVDVIEDPEPTGPFGLPMTGERTHELLHQRS
jgi:CO/xanthine dehydrogenase Mo-binding subunit